MRNEWNFRRNVKRFSHFLFHPFFSKYQLSVWYGCSRRLVGLVFFAVGRHITQTLFLEHYICVECARALCSQIRNKYDDDWDDDSDDVTTKTIMIALRFSHYKFFCRHVYSYTYFVRNLSFPKSQAKVTVPASFRYGIGVRIRSC